jgi:hypothetical protein
MKFTNSILIINDNLSYNNVDGNYSNNSKTIISKTLNKGFAGVTPPFNNIKFNIDIQLLVDDKFEIFDSNNLLIISGKIKQIMPRNSYLFARVHSPDNL